MQGRQAALMNPNGARAAPLAEAGTTELAERAALSEALPEDPPRAAGRLPVPKPQERPHPPPGMFTTSQKRLAVNAVAVSVRLARLEKGGYGHDSPIFGRYFGS